MVHYMKYIQILGIGQHLMSVKEGEEISNKQSNGYAGNKATAVANKSWLFNNPLHLDDFLSIFDN